MTDADNLFEFPCTFPIKTMGEADAGLEELVQDVLEKHVSNKDSIELTVRESGAGNYISVTAKFTAESKAQLDQIYQELSTNDKVKMVL